MATPTVSGNPQFLSPVSAHDSHQNQGYFPPQSLQRSFSNDQQYSSKGYSDHSSRDAVPGLSYYYPSFHDKTPHGTSPSGPWMEGSQSSGSQIIWRPPNPVARPLPSRFSDFEEPLPSFATLEPGISVSKYILNKNPEDFARHIRHTEDWPSVMDDPIFRPIPMDCELISIKELISRREEVYINHNVKVINKAEEGEITENIPNYYDLNNALDAERDRSPEVGKDDRECSDVEFSQRYTETQKVHGSRKRVFDEIDSLDPSCSYDRDFSHEQKPS
ncbi:hypothetical protein Plec18170_009270 [Paecilomyces lecythidis]